MDKQHKKQLKKYITCGIAATLVLLLAVLPLLASQSAPPDGPQASILTTAAEARTIETILIGGGQLSSNATEEITIPEKIKLTEYLVGNGDIVKKGDAIATVDKVSVLTALSDVQETLDHLAGELANAFNASDTDEVTAHAGGLVKILYAQEGDSVRDVMLQNGSLAVLSLDGRMAVDIRRSTSLKAGSTVCVYLEDDTELEGKVESSAGGTLTVSIEDEGYAIGETVTVKTEDGDRLGRGPLYIHNAWNATAYYGTISDINVSEGDTIAAGKTLFELEVGNNSAQFQILASQRQEYEELMQALFRMYDSGVITAPCDGIVTGVDDSGSFLLAAQEQDWHLQLLENTVSAGQSGYTVILLSNETPEDETASDDLPVVNPLPVLPVDPSIECTKTAGCTAREHQIGCPENPAEPVPACTKSENCTGLVHEPGCPLSGATQTTYSGWVAMVERVEGGVAILKKNPNAIQTSSISSLTVDSSSLTEAFTYPGSTYSDGSGIAAGDTVFLHLQGGIDKIGGGSGAPNGTQTPQQGSMESGRGSMGGGMGGGSIAVFEPYSLETLTIASVTSQEEMTLEITVDEQDIACLHTGQEATITVEALTGQHFPATVTSVSNTGTNEGGNSKFSVRLTLSKSGEMLPGMNASAHLTLDTAQQVLSIPVAALVEEGTRTLVYTGYREKTAALTNPVEVTTGVSDGEYVQILSGLENGDTVFYAYYDTLELSTVPEGEGFRF